MKNSCKAGLLTLAIAVSFAACKGKSGASGVDSLSDSSKVITDTTQRDTTVKVDTSKKDTVTVDTTVKTVTRKTETTTK